MLETRRHADTDTRRHRYADTDTRRASSVLFLLFLPTHTKKKDLLSTAAAEVTVPILATRRAKKEYGVAGSNENRRRLVTAIS